jgi:hypothetical protein
MRVSDEQEEKYLAIIRSILRFKPDASLDEIKRNLDRTIKHAFTIDYISKLRKKVLRAQTHALDKKTKKGVMAEFFDISLGLRNQLLPMMTDNGVAPSVVLAAISKYFDIYERTVKILLISGVLDDKEGQKMFDKLRAEKNDLIMRANTPMPSEETDPMNAASQNSGFMLPEPSKEGSPKVDDNNLPIKNDT